MANVNKDIQRWMDLTESMLNEADNFEKANQNISKTDDKLMQVKMEKLNNLIKKKYYEKDEEVEEDDMFQFNFEDKGDHYEFKMPLTVLFGRKSQEYAARFWDDFFEKAGIKTSFIDNIQEALKQAGNINLRMKLNKSMTQEVDGDDEFEE